MENEYLTQLLTIFLLAVGVNIACSRLRLPVTVGFLLTGVIAGPSALGLVHDIEFIQDTSELGVALLMFTIGMELSGEVLDRLKRPVFLGGSLQIGLIIAVAALAGAIGATVSEGVFWGCLIALSSSAIVLHIFERNGTTATPVGRLSLAILVFQDMLVAPMMLLIPFLAGTLHPTFFEAALALLKVALFGLALYVFAKYLLDRLMTAVARTNSSELLLLTTLCLCFGFATLTQLLGMSFSLGAFLAGLMLARSRYAMSAVANVLPYRDVFLSLFFITVGMMLDVVFVEEHILRILLFVCVYIVGKTLLTMPAVLVQGYPLRTAIRTSMCLAQTGEFAFVLAAAGVASGLMSPEAHQFFLATSVLTMMLTPLLMAQAPSLSARICARLGREKDLAKDALEEENEPAKESDLHDHIVIVGFGFTGQRLASAAREADLSYTVLEMNPETLARFKDKEPISFGDAQRPSILEGLGIRRARVLAVAISDPAAVRAIVANARQMNPHLVIIARAPYVTDIPKLIKLGANRVIAEEFEAGVEMFCHVLGAYLVPIQDIEAMAAKLRDDESWSVRHAAHTTPLKNFVTRKPGMGVSAVRLAANSPFAGRTLQDGGISRNLGLIVVAVARGKETYPAPQADFRLEAGDILYVFTGNDRMFEARDQLNNPNYVPNKSPDGGPDSNAQAGQ